MTLEDITNVLFLSCVLMFFYVSSQSGCNRGWFGYQCKYKCRCASTSCDVDGSCMQPYACEGGWFGPACQYADLAYFTANLATVTDGQDHTCNVLRAGDSIMITFNESIIFTWLRIHVTDQGSDALRKIRVTFISNASSVSCRKWRTHAVSKRILDMHCNLTEIITDMTLSGPAGLRLCSVYVSGGRNVAIRELTWQASTYHENIGGTSVYFDSSRAVDGDTHQRLESLSCTHTQNTGSWSVTMSRQRSVHRYVIYNRDGLRIRLIGFQLESFDTMNRSVFVYKDRSTSMHYTYRTVHSPLPVQIVVVAVNNSEKMLTLCEVEVYGDSICDPQHYGRECEHSCRCANNEACFVTTGGCPSGCPAGFHGASCLDACPAGQLGNYCNLTCSPNCQPSQNRSDSVCDNNAVCQTKCKAGFSKPSCDDHCSVGKFGIDCAKSCSQNCQPSDQTDLSSCDIETGFCIKGCQTGFSGDLCEEGCITGTFGLHCNNSCSPNCEPYHEEGVSPCDNKTGACFKGCRRGFTGSLCHDVIPKTDASFASIALILGVCGVLTVLSVLVWFWRRYKQSTESEAVNVHHEQENISRKTSL